MEDKKDSMQGCDHNECCCHQHWGGWSKFSLLRLFLFLFILAFVFWGGVKIGELKSEFSGYFDSPFGGRGKIFLRQGDFGPGMMQNYYYQVNTTTRR